MNKRSQLKRKHHHVWAHYLKHWSLDGKNIYYTTKRGRVACDSVHGLASERDFYKINSLDNEDIVFIGMFSSKSPENLRELHNSYLQNFYIASLAFKLSKEVTPPEIVEKQLKEFQHNALENLHGAHESECVEILKRLNQGDYLVLNSSENRLNFTQFFAMQMTRTKSFKDKAFSFAVNEEAYSRHPNPPYSFKKYQYLMNKNWWFLSYMFGMNIGSHLTARRHQDTHVLLENNTPEPFVTSDNPIINVHDSVISSDEREPPEFMDSFYPISPRYAYMINNSDRFSPGKGCVTLEQAVFFNTQMALKANEHIFAQTEPQIREVERLAKLAKRRT